MRELERVCVYGSAPAPSSSASQLNESERLASSSPRPRSDSTRLVRSLFEARMSDLRQQLKQFEAAFKLEHGRDPSRDDIRNRPEIGNSPSWSSPHPASILTFMGNTQPRNTNSTNERNQPPKQRRLRTTTRPSRPLRPPLPLHLLLLQTRSKLPPNPNAVPTHAPVTKKNSRRATAGRRLPRGDSRPVLPRSRLYRAALPLEPTVKETQAQRLSSNSSSATSSPTRRRNCAPSPRCIPPPVLPTSDRRPPPPPHRLVPPPLPCFSTRNNPRRTTALRKRRLRTHSRVHKRARSERSSAKNEKS